MEPLLKKAWQRAWNLGHESAKRYDAERETLEALSMDELEVIAMIDGCSEFLREGVTSAEWAVFSDDDLIADYAI